MLSIENLSYWEKEVYFRSIDFVVIGAGIVGLNTALRLRELYPKRKILVLERGYLPAGASTKNAGFACFGSPTELLSDLKNHSETEVIDLVKMRWDGLQTLRGICGDEHLNYKNYGSQEVFNKNCHAEYENAVNNLSYLNDLVEAAISKKDTYSIAKNLHFSNISGLISNQFEGQIDTGKMMKRLLYLAHQNNILILNGFNVEGWEDQDDKVEVSTNFGKIESEKLLIASNGLSREILPREDVQAARAQVLITKPIKNLKIKGTFHYDEGYYYFRNVGDRILIGGGRNIDIKGETTTIMETNDLILDSVKSLLSEVVLPNQKYEIDSSWAGIMGVGNQKKPILKKHSKNVGIGIRLGGMGVAIGSGIGKRLAEIVLRP